MNKAETFGGALQNWTADGLSCRLPSMTRVAAMALSGDAEIVLLRDVGHVSDVSETLVQ